MVKRTVVIKNLVAFTSVFLTEKDVSIFELIKPITLC